MASPKLRLILLLTRYAMSKNTGVSRSRSVFCFRSGSYQLVASRMTYQGSSSLCAGTAFSRTFFFLAGIHVLFRFIADLKVLVPERIHYAGKCEDCNSYFDQ